MTRQACLMRATAISRELRRRRFFSCTHQCSLLREAILACASILRHLQDCPVYLPILCLLLVWLGRGRDLLRSFGEANWLTNVVFLEEGSEYFCDVLENLCWLTDLMIKRSQMANDGLVGELESLALSLKLISSKLDAPAAAGQLDRERLIDLTNNLSDKGPIAQYLLKRLSSEDPRTMRNALCIDSNQFKYIRALNTGNSAPVMETKLWGQLDCATKVFGSRDITFQREVAALSSLKPHPHIVRMLGYNQDTDGAPCVMMELLKIDLAELMRQKEPFSILERLEILVGVAKGMSYLHKHKIFHRDLKPGNVVLAWVESDAGGYWKVKIVDFGLSKTDYVTAQATRATECSGTVPYMAPEVWIDKDEVVTKDFVYSKRADVFSFAMLAWHLLHWKVPPWHPRNAKKEQRPPLCTTLPPELRNLLCCCWKTNPDERPMFDAILHGLLLVKEDLLLSNEGLTNEDEESRTSNINEALDHAEHAPQQVPKGILGGFKVLFSKTKVDKARVFQDKFQLIEQMVELKVPMHCTGCGNKIKDVVREIRGVEEVKIDVLQQKLTVKGNDIDANMIVKLILEKTSKAAKIWTKGDEQP